MGMYIMDKEKFEKDMAAFSFKQHQDALTYLSHLKITGWTVDDAKQWVKNIALPYLFNSHASSAGKH